MGPNVTSTQLPQARTGFGMCPDRTERATVLSSDARNYGLGAVLLQRQPSGELKPVTYAS